MTPAPLTFDFTLSFRWGCSLSVVRHTELSGFLKESGLDAALVDAALQKLGECGVEGDVERYAILRNEAKGEAAYRHDAGEGYDRLCKLGVGLGWRLWVVRLCIGEPLLEIGEAEIERGLLRHELSSGFVIAAMKNDTADPLCGPIPSVADEAAA